MLPVLLDSSLTTAGIKHGFFTKIGGISFNNYSSLNCDYQGGDELHRVNYNRNLVANHFNLKLSQLITNQQIHSNKVIIVDEKSKDLYPADALVTKSPKIMLGATSADCPIVLLADPQAKIIGIAHAGWKGAKSGIISNTVKCMEQLGSKTSDIIAAISPCIAQNSYQINQSFYQEFCQQKAQNKKYFLPDKQPSCFLFDLIGYIIDELSNLKIKQISQEVAYDTYTNSQQFFSYRRSFHNNNLPCGRQISVIVLN